jgi:hypothetical protein
MTTITKEFTYNLADDYLALTNAEGRTGTWTYVGPDQIWLEIHSDTGALDNTGFFTIEEDGPNIPVPEGIELVCVDCNINPLLCTLVGADEVKDYALLPQHTEDLPNGNTYSRPADPTPDHTYNVDTAVYDSLTQEWSYEWFSTWTTWDNIVSRRNMLLREVKKEILALTDAPDAVVNMLNAYKDELENLETTWAAYTADKDCIKVQLPQHPIKG